jgi:uncharacterized protein with LGFP repeats
MLSRLALLVALVLVGAGVPAPTVLPAATRAPLTANAGAAVVVPVGRTTGSFTAGSPVMEKAPAEETTVTEVDVVVPAVDAAGDVVVTPEVAQAAADEDVVVADEVSGDRISSEVVETDEFQTLGVTWPGDAAVEDLGLEVRTRADGRWSPWVELDDASDAPDAGTADAANALRGGTDSLWVGDADAVQISFDATTDGGPDGLALTLVDVPELPATTTEPATNAAFLAPATRTSASFLTASTLTASTPTAGAADLTSARTFALSGADSADGVTGIATSAGTTGAEPAATTAVAPMPRIYYRSEWGARPQVCTPDVATNGLVGAVVHHTAGSNAYSTVEQAMQQIRGDQAYHIDGRGWCDIGYNFVVDKWGNVYEGRAGSLTSPVIGVHAGGFNTGTVGVSMLGTYSATPPNAVLQSVGQMIGLRLSAYGVDPRGTMNYYTGSGENSRFANQTVTLPRVFAHRDVAYTSCPGDGGYGEMPVIRVIAAGFYNPQLFAESQALVKALYQDLLLRAPDPTGLGGWTAALMTGTSQTGLVDSLTRSREYIDLRVRKAYTEVLGRAPEPAGALGWRAAIEGGQATVDDVQRRFYDSIEYFTLSGNTPEGYVRRLFTTMLRRDATPDEVTTWTATMATEGRTAVVDAIWFSMEAAKVRAGDYYQVFLGRMYDVEGQTAWAQVLLTYGEGAVRIGIAGSVEYRQRAISRFPLKA